MVREPGLREVLISEAVQLLDSGAADLSLRQVARAAGVSAMAPYRHFDDKAALERAVAEHGFELLRARLEAAEDNLSGTAALIAQGEAYVGFASAHPALFRMMFTEHCAAGHPQDLGASAYAVLSSRVANILAANDAAATLACWAIVHGLATLTLDGRIAPGTAGVRGALEVFVSGLKGTG